MGYFKDMYQLDLFYAEMLDLVRHGFTFIGTVQDTPPPQTHTTERRACTQNVRVRALCWHGIFNLRFHMGPDFRMSYKDKQGLVMVAMFKHG